jgi:PII-like signaling protein
MMIIAVGTGDVVARVLPELGGLLRRPLMTLERVRVCKRDGQRLAEPQPLPATDERGRRLWQKLMVYTSEAAMSGHRPMHQAIVERLRETGASGATTVRGVWGFHGDHAPHGDRLLQLRRHVPVVTIIVDDPARIGESFAIVDDVTRERGLVTSEIVPALAAVHEGRRRGGLRLGR